MVRTSLEFNQKYVGYISNRLTFDKCHEYCTQSR